MELWIRLYIRQILMRTERQGLSGGNLNIGFDSAIQQALSASRDSEAAVTAQLYLAENAANQTSSQTITQGTNPTQRNSMAYDPTSPTTLNITTEKQARDSRWTPNDSAATGGSTTTNTSPAGGHTGTASLHADLL